MIIELAATICMKKIYSTKVSMDGYKGIIYKLRIFMNTCTEADDFTIKKVYEQASIVPFVIDSDIGQITYDSGILRMSRELTVQNIRNLGVIDFPLMNFKQGNAIGCCLLYTSDAADEEDSVDLGGRRIIKK